MCRVDIAEPNTSDPIQHLPYLFIFTQIVQIDNLQKKSVIKILKIYIKKSLLQYENHIKSHKIRF